MRSMLAIASVLVALVAAKAEAQHRFVPYYLSKIPAHALTAFPVHHSVSTAPIMRVSMDTNNMFYGTTLISGNGDLAPVNIYSVNPFGASPGGGGNSNFFLGQNVLSGNANIDGTNLLLGDNTYLADSLIPADTPVADLPDAFGLTNGIPNAVASINAFTGPLLTFLTTGGPSAMQLFGQIGGTADPPSIPIIPTKHQASAQRRYI